MKYIKLVSVAVVFLFTQVAFAQSSPVPMLEKAANQITSTLKNNRGSLKNNPQVIHQAVTRYLLPIVDVTGMSRSVLGRQAWNKATASERKLFVKEFTQLVIRTYSSPLAEYTDEKVKFLPLRAPASGRFARVNSIIVRANGPDIPLNYSLVSKKGQWKIYDLSVEGVSLLQSFRSQFGQVLQHSSMADLIAQMRKKKAV